MAGLLDTCLKLAMEAHAGQKDKAGEPYILHPIRVALTFSDLTCQCVALLHDVMEDSEITPDQILAHHVPQLIVDCVVTMTRKEGESYEEYIQRVGTCVVSRRVKLADLKDNMDLGRMAKLPRWTDVDDMRNRKYVASYIYLNRLEVYHLAGEVRGDK